LKDVNRIKLKIDIAGVLLLAASLSLLSFGAIDFAGEGITSLNLMLMIAGALLIPVYIYSEIKSKNPMVDFKVFSDRMLKYSISAAFFQSLGYLSVIFLIIMYLQGVRSLSPLNASLLLIPGYVVGSFLSPLMGRLSDKYGSRIFASLGIVFLEIAILIFLMLRTDSPLYIVLIASAVAGFGTSLFFPANNRAVMSNVQSGSYGSISGLLRTLQNIGILGSFVIAISVASASIPRSVAFEIFIGTTNLTGGISDIFVQGIDSALLVSLLLLAIAGVFSYVRGKEQKS